MKLNWAWLSACVFLFTSYLSSSIGVNIGLAQQAESANEATGLQEVDAGDDYFDIGQIQRPISTNSKLAQTWFNRGLAMCFGFNHEEAIRCFEKAIKADPRTPMAYWGMGYAMGPNMNNMETPTDDLARADFALRMAQLHFDHATELEKDLILALRLRHQSPIPEPTERLPLNKSYADQMRVLHQKYPDDPLVAVLFVESLINLQPWGHFSREGTPSAYTSEIVGTLENALQRWPRNPALCHLYIHTMEMSPNPEKAMTAANILRTAVPGSGHLVHMPTHIDILVGDYPSVIKYNAKAIKLDDEFVKREGRHNFYTLYRIHNYHFLIYGAMFDGQSELALKHARQLVKEVPTDMLQAQVDFLDAFMPMPLHVLIRFGKWDEILAEEKPADYLPMSTSIWHYARALAHAAKGEVEVAEKERELFLEAKQSVPETSLLFNNSSIEILGVAEAMIDGEIAYRRGDFELAFERLRTAVQRDDTLNYDEPWGWMQPARHALGALLLEQGRHGEAERVYRADLKRRPKNPWSLRGLADCLAAQGKTEEANAIKEQWKEASARADIDIDRSCYCKRNDLE